MRYQYAWLELDRGMWHLLTDVHAEPQAAKRKWADRDAAFAELKEEGWEITGPYPGRLPIKIKTNLRFYGYGLIRTLH